MMAEKNTDFDPGPFELTKLSAQVSVLMAERKVQSSSMASSSADRTVAASYQNLGTFKTAKNIVKNRGLGGLYSGFSLHLCKYARQHGSHLLTFSQ